MLVASQDELDLSEISDETLATRSDKDLDSFSELYNRYLCRVYRFVRSQTPDDPTAEDLTAHVFFRAMAAVKSFRGEGTYKAWLFRIAHNTIATWRHKQSSAPLALEQVPEYIDPSPSPATIAIGHDERQVIWNLVTSLPPTQREVLALRYLEELDIGEIAVITGKTRGAIRILLHRARNGLRHALEEGGHV